VRCASLVVDCSWYLGATMLLKLEGPDVDVDFPLLFLILPLLILLSLIYSILSFSPVYHTRMCRNTVSSPMAQTELGHKVVFGAFDI